MSWETYPERNKLPHGVDLSDTECPIVFVTLTTLRRDAWLANEEVHQSLLAAWKLADAWAVGRYMIMPDHLHYFVSPRNFAFDLETWAKFWKSQCTKHLRANYKSTRVGKWEVDHWDTRLRSWQSYDEKWDYVKDNPVRKKLVAKSEDWPYQGVMNDLRWD